MRYRKSFDVGNEIIVTCLNSFIPVFNVICLIQNLAIVGSKEESIQAMALMLDVVNMDKED